MTPTATAPPPASPAPPPTRPPKDRVLLSDVPWKTYLSLVKAAERKGNARLAYDRGELEIMAPSFLHDRDADNLGYFVRIMAEEFGLPHMPGGSVTVQRRALKKGIEPDRCYWIANAPKLAGVRDLDLRVHPPPDLAIEVDVWNSSLNRAGIYAKLGVPELWRLDGDDLRFYQLGMKKRYVEVPASRALPGVTPADILVFLHQSRTVGDQGVVAKAVRAWVRQQVGTPAPPPATP
ncbi:MAG: Uma2 family endonuclease [Gemmataceae bacterium]|nr:Uma2 family endonuclease [Gemmataceae bacterium]